MSTREPPTPSGQVRVHQMPALEEEYVPWEGWVTFGALVLVMLGCINAFQGLLALFLITLDVIVVLALTARGDEARTGAGALAWAIEWRRPCCATSRPG